MRAESDFDDLKKYLPQFLSQGDQRELFDCLNEFPANIDTRLYSGEAMGNSEILQGDGISGLLIVNIPDPKIGKAPCLVVSNSCDIQESNARKSPKNILYAPIFNLEKFRAVLSRECVEESAIDDTVNNIRKQRLTNFFFLPKGHGLEYDAFARLDRINNCALKHFYEDAPCDRRLFSLSNYGFYLFLIKISIHLTRTREGTNRY